ncbi:MAG: hypothetical protein JWN45_1650 [Acidobacteriaceae bacterium]|nr:hypothetical protein [Acidobacteriaceae bacterium]
MVDSRGDQGRPIIRESIARGIAKGYHSVLAAIRAHCGSSEEVHLRSSLSRLRCCFVFLVAIVLPSAALGSDMDKTLLSDVALRGPVKQCIEQTTYPATGNFAERTSTLESIYSPEGRLSQRRTGQGTAQDYVATYKYDAAGRLLKVSVSSKGKPDVEQSGATYAYDATGRLSSIANNSGTLADTYNYDEHGRKRRIQHNPVYERQSNTAIASAPWEDSELSFASPSGGTVTTIYDERDRPIEAKVGDAAGRVTMRMVRTYDNQGRILSDRLISDDMESSIPEEMSTAFNDAQKKTLANFLARTFGSGESSYKYDSQGRMIEKRVTGGVFGDVVTNIHYNDRCDVNEEETIYTPTLEVSTEFGMDEAGNMIPVKSTGPGQSRTLVYYTYEYDQQNNWTQKTMSVRSEPDSESKVSMTIHRILTYY